MSHLPPGAVVPVTLWRNGDSIIFIRGDAERAKVFRPAAESWKALPAADFDALLARVASAEGALTLYAKSGNAGARISREASDRARAHFEKFTHPEPTT